MKIVFLALLVAGLVSPSAAEEKKLPEINFTQVLIGVDGKPIPGGDCLAKPGEKLPVPGQDCSVLTLSDATVTALEVPLDEDRTAAPKVKFDNDLLARKVYKQKAVTLTVEEIAKIKDRIGKAYSGASVVGASWPLLDSSLR